MSTLCHNSSLMEGGPGRLPCTLSPWPCPGSGGLLRGDSLLLHISRSSPSQREEGQGGRPAQVQRWWPFISSPEHCFQQRGQGSGEQGFPRPRIPLWATHRWWLLGEDGADQPGWLAHVWDCSENGGWLTLGEIKELQFGCCWWVGDTFYCSLMRVAHESQNIKQMRRNQEYLFHIETNFWMQCRRIFPSDQHFMCEQRESTSTLYIFSKKEQKLNY